MCKFNHKICNEIKSKTNRNGVGIVVLTNYFDKISHKYLG
jgi:hypothetical protein